MSNHYSEFMYNERHRWGYMTEQQLLTRLNRITRPGKLEAFLHMAVEVGNRALMRAGSNRARRLGLGQLVLPSWANNL